MEHSSGDGAGGRDIVVVGASAGGLDALANLLVQFRANLPASVLITQHVMPTASGEHARLLGRASPLPVRLAEDGDALHHGRLRRATRPPPAGRAGPAARRAEPA